MRMLKSKIFKITLVLLLAFFLLKQTADLRFGHIDYLAAFDIEYKTQENGTVMISSDWYQFESETRWIHLPYKPGCGRGGYFISSKGSVGYDYSMFAPDYIDDEYDIKYQIREDTINNTVIRFIESEDELGIYVPAQINKEMTSQFLIWPSVDGMKMKKELIEMVSTICFKGMQP